MVPLRTCLLGRVNIGHQGETSAPTTPAHDLANLEAGLLSYGFSHRAQHYVSRCWGNISLIRPQFRERTDLTLPLVRVVS